MEVNPGGVPGEPSTRFHFKKFIDRRKIRVVYCSVIKGWISGKYVEKYFCIDYKNIFINIFLFGYIYEYIQEEPKIVILITKI